MTDMSATIESPEELVALLSTPAADIVYHLDDIAEMISVSRPEVWEAFATAWTVQGAEWKTVASMIIDKLSPTQNLVLLRAVVESLREEDARLTASLVSQLGVEHIGGHVPAVLAGLERSWHEFPNLRDYISVCAKAGNLPLWIGA